MQDKLDTTENIRTGLLLMAAENIFKLTFNVY